MSTPSSPILERCMVQLIRAVVLTPRIDWFALRCARYTRAFQAGLNRSERVVLLHRLLSLSSTFQVLPILAIFLYRNGGSKEPIWSENRGFSLDLTLGPWLFPGVRKAWLILVVGLTSTWCYNSSRELPRGFFFSIFPNTFCHKNKPAILCG